MPRLIDANEVRNHKYVAMGGDLSLYKEGWNDAIDTIMNEAPTVEAIPIEWIKKWANNYCDRYQEKLIECLLRTWSKMGERDE